MEINSRLETKMEKCKVCGSVMQKTCAEFSCGTCFGRALEANEMPRSKPGKGAVVATFDGHNWLWAVVGA